MQIATTVIIAVLGVCFTWTDPCEAQIVTVPNSSPNQFPQNPQAAQIQPPLPTIGVPGTIITSQTSDWFVGSSSIPNPGPSFGSAGRGMPGMSGGPPIKAPMGATDPTASYMRRL